MTRCTNFKGVTLSYPLNNKTKSLWLKKRIQIFKVLFIFEFFACALFTVNWLSSCSLLTEKKYTT